MTKKVYLLPGTMCDERMWQMVLPYLPNHIVLNYLTIGSQSSIDELVDDIAAQLPDCASCLLGFSLGGYLATAFSIKYPERVSQLLVVANSPNALPAREVKERQRTINWLKTHGYTGVPTKRITNLLGDSAKSNQEIIELIRDMDACFGGEVLMQQLLATTLRENLFEQLQQLKMPVDYLVGAEDTLVNIDKLQSQISSSENMSFTLLKDTGHMLPLEQPEAFNSWLAEKIKQP